MKEPSAGRAFRKGAVGAMMDEYERAAAQLEELVRNITDEEFERTRDPGTRDEDCRSIQTVLRHVISSGYGYSTYVRSAFGIATARPEVGIAKRLETPGQLKEMLAHTARTLEGKWDLSDPEITALQIRAPWGPVYDLEQMLEHAIVHVLRHRRQIERFLTEPQFSGRPPR